MLTARKGDMVITTAVDEVRYAIESDRCICRINMSIDKMRSGGCINCQVHPRYGVVSNRDIFTVCDEAILTGSNVIRPRHQRYIHMTINVRNRDTIGLYCCIGR